MESDTLFYPAQQPVSFMNQKSVPSWSLRLLLVALALGESFLVAQSVEVVATPNPAPGAILNEFVALNVVFSEAVSGVDAEDLLVNGVPATGMVRNNPNDYSFTVAQPPDGVVEVTWAASAGIVATGASAATFNGGLWSYLLDSNFATDANFVISEFMAVNNNGLADEDGSRSDWIEILNMGSQPASLDGWYLTDSQAVPTQWRFPFGLPPLQPNNYLLVWASGKNKTNAFGTLHTNFKLSSSSSYLALVGPNTNVVSVFNPYPAQVGDVSFGRDKVDPSITGYFTNSTPGRTNAISGPGFVPEPVANVSSGVYTNDTLLFTLSAPAGTVIRYTINGSLPLTNSTLYTNSLVLSNSAHIKARAFPPAGTNIFPSAVISRNIIFLDSTTRGFTSELPLVVISTQGQAIQADIPPGGKRTEGTLCLIDTFQGRSSLVSTPDFIGNVGVEIFGQTSAGFAKLPYRFEVHDELGNDLSIPIFGLPAESDWKMRNPYNDKTYLNDFLAYELFEKMGNYSCRRRFVEVFIDSGGGRLRYPSDYVGVEVLFESIKQGENRVNIANIPLTATNEPAITGGFIFTKDKVSPSDLDFSTQGGNGFPGQGLKLREPRPVEIRSPTSSSRYTPAGSNQLNYLVRYLNRMERAMYTNDWLTQTGTNHYSHYLDVDSFVDLHWIVEFPKQIDGYRLSSYFHKDREGKLKAGPVWDWNLSFGNANYLRGGQTNGWYYAEQDEGMTANEHIWLRRLINGSPNMGNALPDGSGNAPSGVGDPDFNQKVVDRWGVLRTNVLNATNLMARIDELSTMLEPASARDLWGKYRGSIVGVYQWPNPDGTLNSPNNTSNPADGRDVDFVNPVNYRGTTANSIIGQMKKYVLGRYLWIDNQFTRVPAITSTAGQANATYSVTITPPEGATLYYTLDGTDPRAPGGSVATGVSSNAGPATLTVTSNARVFARAFRSGAWYGTWSGPAAESFLFDTPQVRLTEIMYHPVAPPVGSAYSSSDFEFVELRNLGGPINLERYRLQGGIGLTFSNLFLPANARVVAVANTAAFRSRYPDPSIVIAGEFSGALNNSGDRIALVGPLMEPIQDLAFSPAWYPATDGAGFALVASDETAAGAAAGTRTAWRAGATLGGTPGMPESAAPTFPKVVINEVGNHTTAPAVDRVELFNAGTTSADISGWYLTDNLSSPKKFRIPAGTVIASGGYQTYTEANFNTGATGFAFSSQGEEVYLLSADAGGNLTGYAHGYTFGPQVDGASFGRHTTSDGEEHFVTQAAPSFGAANPGPKVGPIVISEIMYHPPELAKYGGIYDDSWGEYVELRNITASAVSLFDPAFPTNRWALRRAVEFTFPPATSIPAQGSILVVGFDPAEPVRLAAFRARYGIPAEVRILGPWEGQLDNSGDTVELAMPDQPVSAPSANAGLVAYVSVDAVAYRDQSPWPAQADGLGASLHRIALNAFGNDPANWSAAGPGPGSEFTPSAPPTILEQPVATTVVMTNGATASFQVVAGGSGPFRYQWLFEGGVIPDATNASLTVRDINLIKAGRYQAAVVNAGGVIASTTAQLTVLQPVAIVAQPRSLSGRPGTNLVLSVRALSSSAIRYQWYFNGQQIPGANSAELPLPNLQLDHGGMYKVQVTDDISTELSDEVRVAVLVNPVFLVQPVSQSVIRGGSVLLSAVISNSATMPLTYRWKRGTGITSTQITNSLVSYFLITNITASNVYSVLVTNLALRAGTNSANAIIRVVDDTDKDGIPDEYEALYPAILSAANAADAALDGDGDGMSNLAEYIAGTDPTDPKSYLKVDSIAVAGGGTQLELYALSNRSYTVEFRESLGLGNWQTLTNLPAQTANRVEKVVDPYPISAGRLYRIATPVRTDRAIRTPVILQSPASVSARQGSAVALEVAAYGVGEVRYQWRMNGVDIPNATDRTLSFGSVQPPDQGAYSVSIADATGSAITSTASLIVLQPPQIVTAPVSQTVTVGGTARFLVGATGSGSLSYRWLFNGDPIQGATGPTLTLPTVKLTDQGHYQVVVSQVTDNGVVSTRTEPAVLTVSP